MMYSMVAYGYSFTQLLIVARKYFYVFYTFYSDTDTEVAVKLIDYYYKRDQSDLYCCVWISLSCWYYSTVCN